MYRSTLMLLFIPSPVTVSNSPFLTSCFHLLSQQSSFVNSPSPSDFVQWLLHPSCTRFIYYFRASSQVIIETLTAYIYMYRPIFTISLRSPFRKKSPNHTTEE